MFKIGKIKFKNNLCLAPMAGISNDSFRQICKKFGVGLVYSEMISDLAIIHNNKKTMDMLNFKDSERPIAIQLFGSEPETLAAAAKIVCAKCNPDIIDINMGCPVGKVCVKKNAGSALMKDPKKIIKIIKAVKKEINVPLTIKIRAGWDEKNINCVMIAKLAEKAGADAIAIHPRTKKEMFEGKSNWNLIKEVKQAVKIPVIGNGDILCRDDIKQMIKLTKCDAVMIGRGCIGNPWIFKNDKIPSLLQRKKVIKKHLILLKEEFDEKHALLLIRQHIGYYLKGIKNKKEIMSKLFKANSFEELYKIL